MKPKVYKCPICSNNVNEDVALKHKNRYYHERCYEIKLQQEQEKELKPEQTQEQKDFIALKDVLNNLYENPNWAVLIKNIKKMLEQHYTLAGMRLTLLYFSDILEKQFQEEYGWMWIVEHYYSETKDFYRNQQRTGVAMSNTNINNVVTIQKKQMELKPKIFQEIDFD